jgi:hypothetical protein
MNLFNDYYKDLVNEMARSRLKTKMADVDQTGIKRASITQKDAIKKAKAVFAGGKDKAVFSELSKSILSGNDDVDKAINLFNLINNLPDQELKKTKRKLVEGLISATYSPYHSFDQVKENNILQFKYYNTQKISEAKLRPNIAKQFIQNLQQWHGLYFNIAFLLTKLDIIQNPEQFGITEQDFYNMDEVAKRNFIKPKIVKYYKPKSKTDISTDSETSRSQIAGLESRDKSVIFFFGNVKVEDEDEPGGFRIETEPFRSLVTIDPIESQKYSTLKEKEDNVPLKTPPFQKGGGTMLGQPTPPPTGFKYGDRQFIGKTITEIKQMVNHDDAFKSFKQKYPSTDERFSKLYRGMGKGY